MSLVISAPTRSSRTLAVWLDSVITLYGEHILGINLAIARRSGQLSTRIGHAATKICPAVTLIRWFITACKSDSTACRRSVGRLINPQRILLIQLSRIVDQQTFLFHGVTRKHRQAISRNVQPAYLTKPLVGSLNVICFQSGTYHFQQLCPVQTALAAPSHGGVGPRAGPKAPPVGHFCPRARTWSLHHKAWLCFRLFSCEGCPSRSPAEGSEYAHAGKILRDHRGPW